MRLEPDTLKALIDYLIAHGYPENSMAIEYPIGKYRVDLAIIDPNTTEPIIFFEIKSKLTPEIERQGEKQLVSFLKALGKMSIPAYLVFRDEGSPPFIIKRFKPKDENEEISQEIEAKDILPYSTLRESRLNVVIEETKDERKKIVDKFWIICWIFAAIVIYLFYKDYFEKIAISNSQLTLIIFAAILILLPFASKLKILGVEYERKPK